MANWSGFTLTNVGADLQAKINAGLTTLKFTKVGVGSGSGSGSVNALTAMVHKEQDIGIGNVEANGNIVTINFTLTNKGLGSAYKMSEMGLFATDPDKGEVLFAYMTDSTPDTMPADGSATVVSQDVTLNIAFSNTGNVSATIDTGAFVTHENLNTHNSTEDAHSAAFAAHNTDEQAHSGLFQKVKTELKTHNTDSSAHTPILNAIKAISGMSAYDIAPSKTIATMIPLLGLGGIVAQGLGASGYVKFANGLIIQRGILSATGIPSGSKINFLIPMKDYSVCMTDSYGNNNNPLVYSVDSWTSNTYFTVQGLRVKTPTETTIYGTWLAIGWSV